MMVDVGSSTVRMDHSDGGVDNGRDDAPWSSWDISILSQLHDDLKSL
jgi:hypothetical protein